MKRQISKSLIVLLLIGMGSVPGFGQDVQDILDKMIEAAGGRKVLESIKDTTVSGDMDLPSMGMTANITIYHKEPNKFRQDMEVMGMFISNAFDGEVGRMLDPQTGTLQEMSGAALEESKRGALEFGNSVLLNPAKYGVTYSYKGKEKVENREYIVLEQKFPNNDINTLYIDPDTYLLYKMKQKGLDIMENVVDQELFLADYKQVDGVMQAHTMTIYQSGEEFGVLVLTAVEHNSGLEDSFFQILED
jgi:hypothetical protein